MQGQDAENDLSRVQAEGWPGGSDAKPDLDGDPNDMDYSRSANPLISAPTDTEKPAKEEYGSKVKPYSYDDCLLDVEGDSKVKLEDRRKHEHEQNSNPSLAKGERESGQYFQIFESNTGMDGSTASWDRSCVAHESRLLTTNLMILKESKYLIIIAEDPCIFRRPAKRARMVFDGVHVPPLSAAHKRKVVEREREYYQQRLKLKEDNKKLKSSKNLNPGIQKDQDPTSNPYSMIHRLQKIGLEVVEQYFTLDKVTREATVSRAYMTQKWGGGIHATRPNIGNDFLAVHGLNDFMYTNTDFQPYAPAVPGAPGAYLSFATPADEEIGTVRLMTKLPQNTPRETPLWFYAGQYKVVPADPPFLSFREWRDQTYEFRKKWTSEIVRQPGGTDICVRIHARKEIGREPTPSECAEVKASQRYEAVTSEEVDAAYSLGQEKMGIWTMKCVGYDNEFQLSLSQHFPTWELDQQETELESRGGSDLPLRPHGRKRKLTTTAESDFEPQSEDSEETDDFDAVTTDVSAGERKNESGSNDEEEDERFFEDEEEYRPRHL